MPLEVPACSENDCSMDHCQDANFTRNFPGDHIFDLLAMCKINMGVGGATALLNIPVILIFLSGRRFRQDNKLLIALAIGDLFNCLGVALMGLDRFLTYAELREQCATHTETSWTCARKPYLAVRVIGNLWPPAVQVVMGCERAFCVLFPGAFKRYTNQKSLAALGSTVLFTAVALSIGYVNSSLNRHKTVKFDCGRGAVYGKPFATFVYNAETVGYTIAFILNVVAFLKALQIKKRMNTAKSLKDIRRIRICLAITFLSLVLVAVPNVHAMILTHFVPKRTSNDQVGVNHTTVMACANSSLNIFIYLLLNSEFRERLLTLLRCRRSLAAVSNSAVVVSMGASTAVPSLRTIPSSQIFTKRSPVR